jgi:bacterioferritin
MKGLSDLGATLTGVSQGLVTSVQQMRIHRAMCTHWGYALLSKQLNDTLSALVDSLDTCLLAMLAAEITPDLQSLGRLNIGQTVEEILQSERRMALDVRTLTLAVLKETSLAEAPFARRALEDMALVLSRHVALFDQSLELIRQMGIQSFLATRC